MADKNTPNFAEVGQIASNHDDILPQLRHPNSLKIYDEMANNDPTIGAIMFATEQMIRRAGWRVEAGGDTDRDKEAAEFLETCMHDMSQSWTDTITDIISFIPYGWSWHEIVYKLRQGKDGEVKSRYNDGKIGWRKLPLRAQTSLSHFSIDDTGGIKGMYQYVKNYNRVFIPIEKSLHFRTTPNKGNPFGKSMLRNAYRPWFFKKRIEEIEGIGIERDLAGLPVLTPPDGTNIWDKQDPDMVAALNNATKLVTNIRRDHNEGVVLPFGWVLSLLSTGSRRQFDTNAILNRYDQRIAITILADMVLLGADKVGSFALAEVKKSLFGGALEAWMGSIAEVFNRHAIPRLMELNNYSDLEEPPKLVHDPIEAPTLDELGTFIEKVNRSGAQLFPDENLDEHLRRVAKLPPRSEAARVENPAGGTEEEEEEDVVPTPAPEGGNPDDTDE